MKNLSLKIIAALVILSLSAVTADVRAGEKITSNQISELRANGLDERTAAALQALHSEPAGTRDPEMSFETVGKMLEAGLPDDVIRLMIGLDWLTIQESRVPLKPEKVLDLYTSGADIRTVRTMLATEVAAVTQRLQTEEVDLDHAGWNAVRPDAIQPGPGIVPEREMPMLPDPQADLDDLKLGRQKLTRPDGKEVIIYRSPFEDYPTRLGRQIFRKPDGKQTVIYSSPFDQPAPARLSRIIVNRSNGKQVVVYTSANAKNAKKKGPADTRSAVDLDAVMKQLRFDMDLNQYMPQQPRRQAPDSPLIP